MRRSARTLMLELLLLRERYADDDFREVHSALRGDVGFEQLSQILGAILPPPEGTLSHDVVTRKARSKSQKSPARIKREFLADLKSGKISINSQRAKVVLEKIGIKMEGKTKFEAMKDIEVAIMSIPEDRFLDYFPNSKSELTNLKRRDYNDKDEGYLALARHILKPS